MASIEIRSKNVEALGSLAQHLYIVYTNDDGEQWFMRGGPETNDLAGHLVGDILVQNALYTNESVDYDSQDTHLSTAIWSGNDADMYALVALAGDMVDDINLQGFDYEYPFIETILPSWGDLDDQNSNTVVKVLVRAMGLQDAVDTFINDNNLNAPGYQAELQHSAIDRNIDTLKGAITDAGKTVGDFVNELSDALGDTSVNLLNGAKELFGDLLDIAPDFTAHAADNGNIILEGTNGFDTVIDGDTGEVHTGIPHNVAVGGVPTPSVSLSDILSNSPIISGLFGGDRLVPSALHAPVVEQTFSTHIGAAA